MLIPEGAPPGRKYGEIFVVKAILGLLIAIAAVAVAMGLDLPASWASSGDAPWCVMRFGDDIYWDCQYRTAQECEASIASGNRGSCNVNPSPGPPPPTASAARSHRGRRVQ